MIQSCFLMVYAFLNMQSLADIARKEADRRQGLEQQGIEGKIFERYNAPSVPQPLEGQKKVSTKSTTLKSRVSVKQFRTQLQKLDRQIRQDEDRLALKQARLVAGRWALPKTGRLSTQNRTADEEARLQKEIDELKVKLKELHLEREEVYEEGRKAGFLPGELEGKAGSGF